MSDKSLLCTQKYRTPKPLPFGAKMMTSMQKYNMELDNNVRFLCMKYPNEPSMKIKELLEELENNLEMVQDVLQEQGSKPVIESKAKQVKPEKQVSDDPEKKTLKRAVVSLALKLDKATKEITADKEEIRRLRKEVSFYKARSNQLGQEQMVNEFDENMHIY